MTRKLFIRYSRRNTRSVARLVNLMRVTGAAIFRDEDSIAPGQRWRAEISDALDRANTIIVFWSAEASASEEVRAEYRDAIAAGKTVVPILLDATPLTPPLQQFQLLDFSGLFVPHSPEGHTRHKDELMKLLLCRLFPNAASESLARTTPTAGSESV